MAVRVAVAATLVFGRYDVGPPSAGKRVGKGDGREESHGSDVAAGVALWCCPSVR